MKNRCRTRLKLLIALNIFLVLLFSGIVFCAYSQTVKFREDAAAAVTRRAGIILLKKEVTERRYRLDELAKFDFHAAGIIPPAGKTAKEDFLAHYGGFMEASGIITDSLRPLDTPGTEDGLVRFRYRAEVSGSFENLVKFLGAIESSDRFFKVDSFEITGQKPGTGGVPVPENKCTVTISTYAFE